MQCSDPASCAGAAETERGYGKHGNSGGKVARCPANSFSVGGDPATAECQQCTNGKGTTPGSTELFTEPASCDCELSEHPAHGLVSLNC